MRISVLKMKNRSAGSAVKKKESFKFSLFHYYVFLNFSRFDLSLLELEMSAWYFFESRYNVLPF
ncbi:hypothetical protein LEP1GSC050_1823 [Leptospira broomii serovar Hurstbridge str. 5399]|uniref:Uncharacterized protein n=1 Tax=Leptospira broomii serovar Hurstbridge str. 5399 TaxID=1049789 RepID=T0FIB6_9LEPT|nr:hypothetical protein LEP1GSC050_1823 [Leptospira broomii serovar Hurstbridge str. 5399]